MENTLDEVDCRCVFCYVCTIGKDIMKILVSPFSKPLRNGKRNPKDYPYWDTVFSGIHQLKHSITQLCYSSEPLVANDVHFENVRYFAYTKLHEVEDLLKAHDLFMSVDNFLPHLAHVMKKRGIVLWGKSDPAIFGYPENVNLLKDPKFLRKRQFDIWEAEEFDASVFVDPEIVMKAVEEIAFSKK